MRSATGAIFPTQEHFCRTFVAGIELLRSAERAEFRVRADFFPAFDACYG